MWSRKRAFIPAGTVLIAAGILVLAFVRSFSGQAEQVTAPHGESRYAPVNEQEFSQLVQKMSAEKSGILQHQQTLLSERYDLSDHSVSGVNHPEGRMIFPHFQLMRSSGKKGATLLVFDLDFDIRDQFSPEFPAAIYLTTPDLGEVSQGRLVTNQNFYELFNGVLNPSN